MNYERKTSPYIFKQIFSIKPDHQFLVEQIIYIIKKKYSDYNIISFTSLLTSAILNNLDSETSIGIVLNKKIFDMCDNKLTIFIDESVSENIIDILDIIKSALYSFCDLTYYLFDIDLVDKKLDYKILINTKSVFGDKF